jgi:hypothetical protein
MVHLSLPGGFLQVLGQDQDQLNRCGITQPSLYKQTRFLNVIMLRRSFFRGDTDLNPFPNMEGNRFVALSSASR